jgi:HD domain
MNDEQRNELYREVTFLSMLEDQSLRALVERIWMRLWIESGLDHLADASWFTVTRQERRTATTLVEHIRQCGYAAIALSSVANRQGGKVDMDLLVAGAALVDVDKLVMANHREGTASDIARYTLHTVYGAHIALDEGAPLPLVNIILSHSKNSGVRPQSLEAIIIHYADYAVFDMRNMKEGQAVLAADQRPKWARD